MDIEKSKKEIQKKHLEAISGKMDKVVALHFMICCRDHGITHPVPPSRVDIKKALGLHKRFKEMDSKVNILDLIEQMCSTWNSLESVRKFHKNKPELGLLPLCYKELLQRKEQVTSTMEVVEDDWSNI